MQGAGELQPEGRGLADFLTAGMRHIQTNEQSKDYFFVILSGVKNLSFKAVEILHSAALRSE